MRKSARHFLYLLSVTCALGAQLCAPTSARGAACNVPNLVKCLDSACAINADTMIGARCALCGTDLAAGAIKQDSTYKLGGGVPAMQALSLGKTTGITFTDAELKKAPAGAGARYAWATGQCIQKIDGCTADDVSANYDKLIQQSCKAVLSDNDYAAAMAPKPAKTQAACQSEMQNYMADASRCGLNFTNCPASGTDDSIFDKFFSSALVETKCDAFAVALKTQMKSARDSYAKMYEANLQKIVSALRAARTAKLQSVTASCNDGSALRSCVATACGYMPNGCPDIGGANEKSYASTLCAWVNTACNRLK
ncbi:MAG: hypothetical protein FWC51_02805 [Proteobacteria bacterium]|nr:hypothetical protein [Pseudomonadota bacterium]